MQLPTSAASFLESASKLPQQKIAKVISILLLIYIAYLFAQITWLLFTPETSPAHMAQSGKPKASQQQSKQLSITDLLSLNLFGLYQEKAEPVQVIEEDVESAPETRLKLILSATVASDDKATAAAVIENMGKQETYGIGDTVVGTRATLEKVLTDRVLIKQSGRLETLMLDGFDYAESNAQRKRQQQAPGRNLREVTENVGPKVKSAKKLDQRKNKIVSQQAKQMRNDIASNPGKITDYLKISPRRDKGKVIGYRLMPGKNPELFKSSGLKPGDVAIQMNGFDLTTTSEAAQALTALKQDKEVSLLIMRGEELTELLFSIDN